MLRYQAKKQQAPAKSKEEVKTTDVSKQPKKFLTEEW
jgi:hypothetical protein